jgi:hypothetical protein
MNPNTMISMTTQEVADRFDELIQQGQYAQIYEELYSPDAVSIEPEGSGMQNAHGMPAILEKGKTWNAQIEEMHGGYMGKPAVAGNFFCCTGGMEATIKGRGRVKLDEVCVYEVQAGKIVREQFFF